MVWVSEKVAARVALARARGPIVEPMSKPVTPPSLRMLPAIQQRPQMRQVKPIIRMLLDGYNQRTQQIQMFLGIKRRQPPAAPTQQPQPRQPTIAPPTLLLLSPYQVVRVERKRKRLLHKLIWMRSHSVRKKTTWMVMDPR